MTAGLAPATATAAKASNSAPHASDYASARASKPAKVSPGQKRTLNRAVAQCGYFLQRCPFNSWGERNVIAAGRGIMCSPRGNAFKYTYPSLSINTPKKSWATTLVQIKLACSQKASGQRVTVAVDGRFGPVTAAAWRNEARYGPISADGNVSGQSDWVWVFMFFCGD